MCTGPMLSLGMNATMKPWLVHDPQNCEMYVDNNNHHLTRKTKQNKNQTRQYHRVTLLAHLGELVQSSRPPEPGPTGVLGVVALSL